VTSAQRQQKALGSDQGERDPAGSLANRDANQEEYSQREQDGPK